MSLATKWHCTLYTDSFLVSFESTISSSHGRIVHFSPADFSCQNPLSCHSECWYLWVFWLWSLNFSGILSSSSIWEASKSALHPRQSQRRVWGLIVHAQTSFPVLYLKRSLRRAATWLSIKPDEFSFSGKEIIHVPQGWKRVVGWLPPVR